MWKVYVNSLTFKYLFGISNDFMKTHKTIERFFVVTLVASIRLENLSKERDNHLSM